ncbi:MAG: TnpV protein [Lawsonibacter sp.]|nr:TnpV protein [Lawsonibacter sp.]
MENRKNINGINYVLAGDYYIPDLRLPNEERSIGKYGRMHREYLKEHNPIMFNDLVLEGQLWTYLADLNEQAQNRLQRVIRQMQEAESVTEELKENDQWLWIQKMNSIHNRAEEIILHELVYGEDVE